MGWKNTPNCVEGKETARGEVFPYCCVKRKLSMIPGKEASGEEHVSNTSPELRWTSILVQITLALIAHAALKGPLADFRCQRQQEIADSDLFPSSTGFGNQIRDNSNSVFSREVKHIFKVLFC